MIDVNASLGDWPFEPLKNNSPAGLLRWLSIIGVRKACVGALEAVWYQDVQAANRKLHRAVGKFRKRLIPLAVINPNFPGWEDDLAECVEDFSTAGVRLFPAYHGYTLKDACCRELFEHAGHYRLPVQIAPQITDHRMQHPKAYVPPASLDGLAELLREFPKVPTAVINVNGHILPDRSAVRKTKNLFVDISWADGTDCVDEFVRFYGLDRILFGTNAPLMEPLSAAYKLKESSLTRAQMKMVTQTNAMRFLAPKGVER